MKIFLKDPDATADFGIKISKLISDSKNNAIETNKFLIPTVQESPDLLDGLFVTF